MRIISSLFSKFLNSKKITVFFLLVTVVILGMCYYPIYKEHLKWKQYFKRTKIEGPNVLVSTYFSNTGYVNPSSVTVLDLGAGNGSDTVYLSNKGYIVYAVDFQSESINRIKSNSSVEKNKNIQLIQSDFKTLNWEQLPKFDVIIAINSISFMKSIDFHEIWDKISVQLKPNGIIILRLFGDKLNWPNMNHMTLLNKNQINHLVNNFKVIKMEEEFYTENQLKQHAFNLILKKK